jgi:hypothetical protein
MTCGAARAGFDYFTLHRDFVENGGGESAPNINPIYLNYFNGNRADRQ